MAESLNTPERVWRFLDRMRRWMEETRDAWTAAAELLDRNDDYEAQLQDLERRGRILRDFEKEQRGLLEEWRSAGASDEETARVRAVAAEVAELTETCVLLERDLQERIAARRGVLQRERAGLGQGRDMTRRYRPLADETADYLDRDA